MRLKINDTDVYYEIIGEGIPILLIHGWSLDHHKIKSTLEPVFEDKPGWKRIYLDLPGHGKSPGSPSIQSQDKILEVVLEFIDRVIGKERFLVAGTSLGAYLARGIIYHKQNAVDGMLLIIPLIIAEDKLRDVPPPTVIYKDLELLASLSEEDDAFQNLAVVQSQEVLEIVRNILDMTGEGDEEFLAKIRENPERYSLSEDIDQLPEPFMGPSLIIAGRQDIVVGYQDAWKILENFPRATFAVLDRAGHLLDLEQKELLHTLVGEWLERVKEYMEG